MSPHPTKHFPKNNDKKLNFKGKILYYQLHFQFQIFQDYLENKLVKGTSFKSNKKYNFFLIFNRKKEGGGNII
jgi:hypothetical protein